MILSFGALCPQISEQLKDSGIPEKKLEAFDLIAKSITVLRIHGYMSDSVVERARKKLVRAIETEYEKFCGVARALEAYE